MNDEKSSFSLAFKDTLLGWLVLSGISLLAQLLAFFTYTRINPQEMGFMGDETRYGFESVWVFVILLTTILVNLAATVYFALAKQRFISRKTMCVSGASNFSIVLAILVALFTPLLRF